MLKMTSLSNILKGLNPTEETTAMLSEWLDRQKPLYVVDGEEFDHEGTENTGSALDEF